MSWPFGNNPENARPKLCPACGTLVGATATKCHQCGASMTFSLAAASRSLGRFMPTTSPGTYGILTLSCLLYAVTLLATMRQSGFEVGGGLFNLGSIGGQVLLRMGASLPLPYNLAEPWRFVTAVFLHASLTHIAFNMWALMAIGPQIEELYGTGRYLFLYVVTGIGGYLASSATGHLSVGGSGALLGLCGVAIAITTGRRSIAAQMLRSQVVSMLIYIAVIAFLPLGGFVGRIDNYAHIGGFACGFALGKLMVDRPPADTSERKRANLMGWAAAIVVLASFAMAARGVFFGG